MGGVRGVNRGRGVINCFLGLIKESKGSWLFTNKFFLNAGGPQRAQVAPTGRPIEQDFKQTQVVPKGRPIEQKWVVPSGRPNKQEHEQTRVAPTGRPIEISWGPLFLRTKICFLELHLFPNLLETRFLGTQSPFFGAKAFKG